MPTFTVTLSPGDTIVLPSGAKITGVFVDGNAEVTSSCSGELPASSDYTCGVFYFNLDDDDNDNHPNDEDSTFYSKLFVGDVEYELDGRVISVGEDPDYVNAYVPDQGLFSFKDIEIFTIDDSGDNKRRAVYVFFKVATPFFATTRLVITSHVGGFRPSEQHYFPLQETECDDYSTGEL